MRAVAAGLALAVWMASPVARAQQPAPQPPPPQQPYPQQPYPQQPPPQYPQQPYPQQPPPQYPPQQPYPQQPPPPAYPPQPYPYPAPGGPPPGYGQYPGAPPPGYPPPPAAPARIQRRGFVLGFALGPGWISANEEAYAGFGFTFKLGGMLTPNFALLFDYSTVVRDLGDGLSESHGIVSGAAQVFFARFLWAKAGLGVGQLRLSNVYGTIGESESSLAFTGAIGAEVLQTTGGFALDIQLRVTGAAYENPTGDTEGVANTSLLLGFNFY